MTGKRWTSRHSNAAGRQSVQKILVCDFETTVYEGQDHTEVWAAASVEIGTEDVRIFHSINEIYHYYISLQCNVIAYFHNLKFDGAFWLDYIINTLKYEPAIEKTGPDEDDFTFAMNWKMREKTFKYSISDMGQWYTITIRAGGHLIEIRDSLKLLPFSVKAIGKGFKTKHQKLEMEYKGFRYAGCEITQKEREYIANDVLVVKEALEFMFNNGHSALTIGSCCLREFKKVNSLAGAGEYSAFYPDLYAVSLPEEYGEKTEGDWIRRAYKGGWCYVVKQKAGCRHGSGFTADVNSLYPSMMHSESGNEYPVGAPHWWKGEIPEEALKSHRYYFVRIRCRFRIKPGKLPFIQIKGTLLYIGKESLETSDLYDKWTNSTVPYHPVLTLTQTDYVLFCQHYDVEDLEILDGCWFYTASGIFDDYIDKYREMKINSTGAMRQLAKLFLNSLYGKFAANTNSSFKFAFPDEDGTIIYKTIDEHLKRPGYIPIGAAITSYARNFTIRAAQANYYGPDQPGFIYADTDSIHCDLPPEQARGIQVHDKNFCCWKLESYWDEGFFTRQKTYIEHVTHEDGKLVNEPYYNVKCAGMPSKCKNLFILSMTGGADPDGWYDRDHNEWKRWKPEEKEFLFKNREPIRRTLEDFRIGLKVPGKLRPKRIPGGIVLVDTEYTMR